MFYLQCLFVYLFTVSPVCTTVLHTFDAWQVFLFDLSCNYSDIFALCISFQRNYELLFGMPCGKDNNNLKKLNFCLLFANYYLHYRKVNDTNIDWVEFTAKVNYKLRIENQVSGSLLWCFFALFVLLILLKGFRNMSYIPRLIATKT